MKKLLLFILALVSLSSVKAQDVQPTDTTSVVLLNRLQTTESHLVDINNSLRYHAQLMAGAFALEGLGAVCLLAGTGRSAEYQEKHAEELSAYRASGAVFCVLGGVMYIASYIPIWRKELKVDERGITLSIPISK
jgi:hypothetical protein